MVALDDICRAPELGLTLDATSASQAPKNAKRQRAADAANAKTSPLPPDKYGEALVAHKLVPNIYLLDLNRGLMVPYDMVLPAPWNLPSRLFRFPIEVGELQPDGDPRRLGLVHPLLADHPFVRQVEATLGVEIGPDGAPNEYGYTNCHYAMWWHAVDLISAGRWKDLLETERFTTPEHIAKAVSFGLDYSSHGGNGHISIVDARKVLAHIGVPEPADRLGTLHYFSRPHSATSDKGKETWPINSASGTPADQAWATVIGIEAGWFVRNRAGFLNWSPAGRDKYSTAVVGSETVVVPEPKAVAATVQEPAAPVVRPKPTIKPQQLDLF